MKFYICQHCKNIIAYLNKDVCNVRCCGEEMVELRPNTSDGAGEKHVPVIERSGNTVTVKVGAVAHPMLDAHYIQFVALATEDRIEIRKLKPGEEPKAEFACDGSENVTVYEYCNLHGLWKAEL